MSERQPPCATPREILSEPLSPSAMSLNENEWKMAAKGERTTVSN